MPSEPTYFPSQANFRRWLGANHGTAPELLVGFWKKGTSKPSIDWPQARARRLATLIECSAAGQKITSFDIGRKK